MTLPVFNNQNNVSSFNDACRASDAKRLVRLKIKRRYIDSGISSFDADWTTITSDIISIGDIDVGIDDQEFISGVIKNSSLDITLDNSQQHYNDGIEPNSLFYDSITDYYIADSLVELEYGFAVDGVEYYATDPFLSGVIRIDSLRYNADNTVSFSVFSKLNVFRDISVFDIIKVDRRPDFSGLTFMDKFIDYVRANLPTAYGMTSTANFSRNDVFYKDITQVGGDVYSFIEDYTKESGSIFCLNRKNEYFMTYFGNQFINDTHTSLLTDSNTISYWDFSNFLTGTPSYIPDSIGSNHLYLSLCSQSFVSDKFNTGREVSRFYQSDFTFTSNVTPMLTTPTITGLPVTYSLEMLFKWDNLPNWTFESTNTAFAEMISTEYTGSDSMFKIGYTKDIELDLNFIAKDNETKLTNQKPLNIGDDQWYYFCAVRDGDIRRWFLNGTRVLTDNLTTASHTTSQVRFFLNSFNQNLYLDSMKLSNVAKGDDDVKEQCANIFNNKVALNTGTSSKYTFYNWGNLENIYEMYNHDKGFKKIFNVVDYGSDNSVFNMRTEFGIKTGYSVTPPPFPSITVYNGMSLVCRIGRDVKTLTSISSQGAIFNFLNRNFDDITVKQSNVTTSTSNPGLFTNTTYAFYTIDAFNRSYDDLKKSYLYWKNGINGTIPSLYLDKIIIETNQTSTAHARFEITDIFNNYVFVDTASVYKYGRLSIDFDSRGIDDISQTALMAKNYLDERAFPRETISIKARFLEGDIDILDKITLNIKNDIIDNAMEWDTDSWDTMPWAEKSGAFDWQEKDFFVVGITHSWEDNFSEYRLKEI